MITECPLPAGALSEQDKGIAMDTSRSNTAIKTFLFLAGIIYAAIGGIVILNEDYVNTICMLGVLAGIAMAEMNPQQ